MGGKGLPDIHLVGRADRRTIQEEEPVFHMGWMCYEDVGMSCGNGLSGAIS
jgi:hypothetical protein